ncbi:MAG: dihydroneopterin aldolase [Vicingaceae bacterium]
MAKIFLDGIEVYSFHGYSKEERKIGGKYRIDLVLEIDTANAELSDKLKDTINYERVFAIVHQQMGQPSKLLEHLGRKVLDSIVAEFPVIDNLRLTIAKMHPPLPGIMKSVAVELNYSKG